MIYSTVYTNKHIYTVAILGFVRLRRRLIRQWHAGCNRSFTRRLGYLGTVYNKTKQLAIGIHVCLIASRTNSSAVTMWTLSTLAIFFKLLNQILHANEMCARKNKAQNYAMLNVYAISVKCFFWLNILVSFITQMHVYIWIKIFHHIGYSNPTRRIEILYANDDTDIQNVPLSYSPARTSIGSSFS